MACVGALVSQRVMVSVHSCPVLCRADKCRSNLLVLVLLQLALLELSSQALQTEHRARPGFVQCVSLAFHADVRMILGITGTRHVELVCSSWNTAVCRIRDALDPLAGVLRWIYLFCTSLNRILGASLWSVAPTSLRFCVVGEPPNFDSGNTGTFTCSVPSSEQMFRITESKIFSSDLINRFGLPPVRALLQHSLDPTAMLSIPQRSL